MQTTPTDLVARRQQELAEQRRAGEQAYRRNVEVFTSMFLSLGVDVTRLDGTRFDGQLLEARGLAASRWNRLLQQEEQVAREEQALAARPKTRPAQPGDQVLPDRTLAQRDADWQEQTKAKRAALAELRKLAAKERKELEAFTR
jgi:hypothetical protein